MGRGNVDVVGADARIGADVVGVTDVVEVVDPATVVDVVDVVDDVDVVVADVVVVVPESEQTGTLIVFVSNVTAPPRARTRPWTVAPVSNVIEVVAMIVPAKFVVVPRVAELPTCQKTLHACAPFSRTIALDDAVVSVEPI
jgi:hypothetical protein